MRHARLIAVTSTTLVLAGMAGQASGAAPLPGAARQTNSAHQTNRVDQMTRVDPMTSAALSDALLIARSSGPARQRALAGVAAAATGPTPLIPTPGSLIGLESDCSLDEAGGSSSGRGGSTTASAASAVTNRELVGELIPAGHLHGSGTDVLDYRLGVGQGALRAGVTARSAKTGAALWSRTIVSARHALPFPFPEVDKVGPSKQQGVLLIDESIPVVPSGTHPATLTVTAVSGAGKTLWTQTITGSVASTDTSETDTSVPVLVGDIHAKKGSGHDLLIDLESSTASFGAGISESGTIQPEVMSAVNGGITPLGPPVSSTAGVPTATSVPDLNRDGLDDIVVTVPTTHGGNIVAERGDTGATIWTSPTIKVLDAAGIDPVGFVTHAHTQDLAVTTLGKKSLLSTLLDGRSGKVLWSHPADCAFALGHAGVHHRPAVGLITDEGNVVAGKTSTTRVTLAAVAAHGSVIYRKSVAVSVTAKKTIHSETDAELIEPFDDVQPDGSADTLVRVEVTVGKLTASKTVMLSGRDGSRIASPKGLPADGSLQRGKGTDLVRLSKGSSSRRDDTVSGYDAATGTKLYTRNVAGTRGLDPGIEYGVRLTGHHCSDLVLGAESKSGLLLGLYDAKGQPVWAVSAAGGHLTGGHVTLATPPSSYCVA